MINKTVENEKISEGSFFRNMYLSLKNLFGILCALIVLCLVLSLMSDKFMTWKNIVTVLRTVSINAIVGFGMTFVILIGGIDLSVGAIMSLCGVLCTILISLTGLPIFLAIIVSLMLGLVIGLFNGVFSTKFRIAPFIVTLAMSYIVRGFSFIITGGSPISVNQEAFYELGNGYLGPIPWPIVYMIVIFGIMSFALNRVKFGRRVYAIGGNEEAARFSGIKVDKIKIICYAIIGMLASLCGIITCAKLYSGQPTIGQNAELDAIAAVILGGTSFSGGIGTLGGSLIGAIVIGVINNGLNLLGVNSFWQSVAKGVVILIAVYVDMLKYRKKK